MNQTPEYTTDISLTINHPSLGEPLTMEWRKFLTRGQLNRIKNGVGDVISDISAEMGEHAS